MVARARRSVESWDRLSLAYRSRLQASGYGLAQYLAGESAAAARGHGITPEHPERAQRHPERYPEYIEKHKPPRHGGPIHGPTWEQAFQHLWSLLRQAIDDELIDKLDRTTVRDNMINANPRIWELALSLDLETLQDLASDQGTINPFWYH